MTRKSLAPPKTQRRFAGNWVELVFLCKKVHYWLHTRKDRSRAKRYRDRLERVLSELPKNDLAIIRQEGLALLAELSGDTGGSIVHRTREIELMERLHRSARNQSADTRAYLLQDRDAAVLSERRAFLEALSNAPSAKSSRSSNRAKGSPRKNVARP